MRFEMNYHGPDEKGTSDHQKLKNLQGGFVNKGKKGSTEPPAGEYYHLSKELYDKVIAGGGGTVDHEQLVGLQGGEENEHLHLTSEQLELVNAYKGYFLTEDALNQEYPPGSPSLKGGEYAFVDDADIGVYLFEYTPVRNVWVRDASVNWISKTELESGIMLKSYAHLNAIQGDLRFKKNGHKIDVQMFDSGVWSNVTTIGSISTDCYYLKSDDFGSMVGINDLTNDGRYYNVFRRYIYTNVAGVLDIGNEFGSLERSMCLSVESKDGLFVAYPTEKLVLEVQPNYSKSLSSGTYEYTFKCPADIEFAQAEFQVSETTKARMWIVDVEANETVYESQTRRDAMDTLGALIVDDVTALTTGKIVATFPRIGFMSKDRTYKIHMQIFSGVILGYENFIRFAIHGNSWKEEVVATRDWIHEQAFSKPQSLQDTLLNGNIMSADTNIRLLGVDNSETFDITKTNVTYTNDGHIDFNENGYLFSSINLSTVTPRETSMLTINLNPIANISPKLVTFHVDGVPNKPINLPDNIFFTVTEVDDRVTRVPHKYNINTEVSPMVGVFSIKLDGREIKNVSMTVMKGSTNGFPNFTGWGYMKLIQGYSGTFSNLFEKEDGKYIINPQLVKAGASTNVYWNDVKDKPTDLLTETLLTTNQHKGIPTTSNGKGLYSKQSIDTQAERNIARYDEKDGSVEVGDVNEALRLNYSYLWGYRNIGSDSYLVQEVDTDTLLGNTFTTELVVQEDGTKVTDIAISIKQDCLVTLSLNDIIMAENKPCTVGRFMIPIPMYELHSGGTKIKVDIISSVADSIGGLLLPTPSPFIGYIGTMFTEGQILSDADLVNRLELNSKGAIVKRNRFTNTDSKLISFEKDNTIFGSHDQRAIIASSRPIGTSIIEDSQGVISTESEVKMIGSQFTFSVPNTFIDNYYLDSITLSINKNTRIECEIDGNAVMGDGHLFRKVGEHTLKSSYRAPIGKTINVSILTKDAVDCLVGSYDEENKVYTPKVTINLIKTKNSEICTKDVARNIEVQNGDNIIVQANLTGLQVPYDLDWLGFEVPEGRQMPSVISRDFNEQYILIENDFVIGENEKFTITIPDLRPLHSKSRVSFNFNVYQKNGYVNLVKLNPKTISVKSTSGEGLRPEFNYNLLEGQPQIQIIVDFNVVDDVFIIEFGEGNVFSGSETTLTIWETTSTIQSPFQQPMFDERGRIHKSLMSSEYASTEQLQQVSQESRNINVFNGDTIYINTKQESRKYDSPKLISQSENFIRYAVSDAVLYDLPTIATYQNKYSTLYGTKSNIVSGGFINTRIMDMGGNYSIPQDKKAIITYYLFNTVKAPVLNGDTIKLFDSSDAIIPSKTLINISETNATIEFMVEKLSNTIIVNFGEGNDLSGCNVLMDVSIIREDIIGTPMIDEFGKINKELYSGWDKKLDLTKENIDVTIPDNSNQVNADLTVGGTRSKGIVPATVIKTENDLTFVDYGSNCVLDELGEYVDVNLTIPESYIGALCDVEYRIDYKTTAPIIVLDDFTIYEKPDIQKTVRDEDTSKIITFKDVALEDVIRLRTTPASDTALVKTNLSNCTTSSVKFIKVGMTETVPMFINNKLNEKLSNDWDMKVDLPSENITISKSVPVEYKSFHTIPFDRADEWVPNEWTIFSTRNPQVDLNQCTHFTIKGENSPPDFTDTSVQYRLIVEDIDGIRVTTDCVACTGMANNIYNKLKSPIPAKCSITLLVNSLENPDGFLPSSEYAINFCTSSGGMISVPLFDAKAGLLNKDMMPQTNKANEIELYSIQDSTNPQRTIEPSITYDSKQYGKMPIISLSTDKSVITNVSSYLGETNFYGIDSRSLRFDYANATDYIKIADMENPLPLDGETWKTAFTHVGGVYDTMFGIETYVMGSVNLNIKIRRADSQDFVVNKNFNVSGGIDSPDGAYLSITQTNSDKTLIASGEYEIIITRLSTDGTLYGDVFPLSRLMIGNVRNTSLVPLDTIMSQVKYQTTSDYFIIGEGDSSGIITGLNHSIDNSLQCDIVTIPIKGFNNGHITGIAPNVFPSESFYMRTIVIEANFTNVHPSNFRDSENKQFCKLVCNPNNPSYLYLRSLGYTVDSDGTVPSTSLPNLHLVTDNDGAMTWTATSSSVGDVYLSQTMRIRASGSNFLFEAKVGEVWQEVGKMGL